jgi:hypothetical protein
MRERHLDFFIPVPGTPSRSLFFYRTIYYYFAAFLKGTRETLQLLFAAFFFLTAQQVDNIHTLFYLIN